MGQILLRLYAVAGVIGIAAVLLLGPRLRTACALGILALLAYDLFHANRNSALRPYHDVSLLDGERESFDFIRSRQGFDRTYIRNEFFLFDYAIMAKQGTLRGIYSVTDYEPLSLDRYARFFALIDTPGATDYRTQTFAGWLYLDPSPARLRLLDLMSVRFIVAPAQALPFRAGLHSAGWSAVLEPETGDVVVYENPNPLPRAYVAGTVHGAASADDALAALQAPEFDPHRTVVLEGDRSRPAPIAATSEQGIVPARIAEYTPTQVVVETDASAGGYLLLTDTYYPGWEATLDGAPAEIYRANYLFRAVAVPPGRHTVAFAYIPRMFRLGAGITLLTLCGLAVAGGLRWSWGLGVLGSWGLGVLRS
ncbi:YfhO family protein [Candidatus Binatia bacterium]|nr:YfhO family protein [Candidatus Binatia bacterium]